MTMPTIMGRDAELEAACGRLLAGDPATLAASYERFLSQPVDQEWMPATAQAGSRQTTLAAAVSVRGPGTFFGRAQRTLVLEPCNNHEGWSFDRTDLPASLPIRVAADNVWTTVRSIVLCSGSPHNYMRMVEHIVALKNGLGLDNVVVRIDSGDPPLFERGSMDLVEAVERVGMVEQPKPVRYLTVREPVSVAGRNGSFLCLRPAEPDKPDLNLDCAVDFRSAIGRQRIRIRVSPEVFRYGAIARTNCTFLQVLFSKTIGQLFADVRNLGYTRRNILIAGRWRYVNRPRLVHHGKPLETVWHRAVLDLLAALALIDGGRFVGDVVSYKSGHTLDVAMIRALHTEKLVVPLARS
jgi:UDP-3-O-[3-hydroxymyristoyl] N-acetylglucosamine deacetylase